MTMTRDRKNEGKEGYRLMQLGGYNTLWSVIGRAAPGGPSGTSSATRNAAFADWGVKGAAPQLNDWGAVPDVFGQK